MKPFLLEIGTEELPARFIKPAKEALNKLMEEVLETARLGHGPITVFGTPRRLAVLVDDVEEGQKEMVNIKFGPPAARAFDGEGKPLPAAVGFAKSQGVDVSELKVLKKDKAELLAIEKIEKGRGALEVLPCLLADMIGHIPFQKKMRWGKGEFEFARPLHWLVALLGSETVPFTVAGIESGNASRGHRFLSSGPVIIADPSSYVDLLRQNHIIVDEAERMSMMRAGIAAIEKEAGGRAVADEDLIDEILYITEYPYALKGTFEKEYLDLPREALVNVMKGHQRYIPLEDEKGELIASFIFFANTIPKKPEEVMRGNEKVLRARLADARFFFDEDKRTNLENLYDKLSSVVFHVRLGNLKAKTERVALIAAHLNAALNLAIPPATIERASKLIKADLLTHMVGEFPELQGVMGRIYAEHQGEESDVARSIEEHYYPSGPAARLPETDLGTVMALADKIDSLTAFFSVGVTPTGNLDPFALRRQSLGVIKIVVAKGFHMPLADAIGTAYNALGQIEGKLDPETVKTTLADFITTRFRFSMVEEGHNQEFVGSILPFVSKDIYDGYVRLSALETQKSIEDFQRLMIGFKRVYNITKAMSGDLPIDPALIDQKEEQNLYELYESKKDAFQEKLGLRQYAEALAILVGFKETIDEYFNKVFVMVDDETIKNNRLSLLAKIKDMFLGYGDFSKIRVEEIR